MGANINTRKFFLLKELASTRNFHPRQTLFSKFLFPTTSLQWVNVSDTLIKCCFLAMEGHG